ncbi:MAG: AAA family ATPase [Pseudomonadota bacterium]
MERGLRDRRYVTVLYVDVVKSTNRIVDLDPEEAEARVLSPQIDRMTRIVESFGGEVLKHEGDGIKAVFGAPEALEDHAFLACSAALAIADVGDDPTLTDLRLGVHSGEVVSKDLGLALAQRYDVIGGMVAIAKRLEENTPPGGILISDDTLRAAGDRLILGDQPPIELKGIAGLFKAHLLLGVDHDVSRFGMREAMGLSPFVGRDAAWAELERHAAAVAEGAPRLVCLTGDPGIGKSRLAHEFAEHKRAEGWRIRIAAGDVLEQRTPFQFYRRLVLFNARLDVTADVEARTKALEALRSDLARHAGPAMAETLPERGLRFLFGLDTGGSGIAGTDGAELRREVQRIIIRLAALRASDGPILIILDDLHLADVETRQLLLEMADELVSSPILVIGIYRPEAMPQKLPHHARALPVEALEEEPARLLATALLREKPHLRAMIPLILERAGDNPLFIEELTAIVRAIDEGADSGPFSLTTLMDARGNPPSLRAVISARVDQLTAPQRALLEYCAILGNRFTRSDLGAMPEAAATIDERLQVLCDARLLRPLPRAASETYTFRQAMTREVVYGNILRSRRRALHGAILARVEAEEAPETLERTILKAEHAYHAERWRTALDYLERLCGEADHHLSNEDALVLFDRAFEALNNLEPEEKTAQEEARLHLQAAAVSLPLGKHARRRRLLDRAVEVAKGDEDPLTLAACQVQIASACWASGEHERALDAALTALDVARAGDAPKLAFAATSVYGMVQHALGEYRSCIDTHERLLEDGSGLQHGWLRSWPGHPKLTLCTFIAAASIEIGDFPRARRHLDAALQSGDPMQHSYSRAMVLDFEGYYRLIRGEHDAARAALIEGAEICRSSRLHKLLAPILAKLGWSLVMLGDIDAAEGVAAEIEDRALDESSGSYMWFWRAHFLARLHAAQGAHAQAWREVERGLKAVRAHHERGHEASLLLLAAQLAEGHPATAQSAALDYARSAMQLAVPLEMSPVIEEAERFRAA